MVVGQSTRYYRLDPEASGGIGRRSVLDHGKGHPKVLRLHHVFEGWLGDDLISSYPTYIITKRVAEKISGLGATGFMLREVEVTKSEQFELFHPDRKLPDFLWLDVTGTPGKDDFGLDELTRLIVSERAFACLSTGNLRHCGVEAYWQIEPRQLELGVNPE